MKHKVRLALLCVGCLTLIFGMSGCSSNQSSEPPTATSIAPTISQPTGKQEITATASADAAAFLTQTPPADAATEVVTTQPTAVSADNPDTENAEDALTAIAAAQRAVLKVKSYRERVIIVGPDTAITNTYEFLSPDRSHIVSQSRGSTSEWIDIGDSGYMRKGDSTWQGPDMKSPFGSDGFTDAKAIEEMTKYVSDTKFLGKEDLNGTAARVYTFNIAVPMGTEKDSATSKSTEKFWVADAENMPMRLEGESKTDLNGQVFTSKTIITWFDYNADIKIEAPDISKTSTQSSAATPSQIEQGKLAPGTVDACALITSEEVGAILGEPTGEGKLLDNSTPSETNSICDYTSQQLTLTGSSGGAISISLRQLQNLKKAQNAFDFITIGAPGEAVPGIGDQAFWNTQTKRLFVRKGSAFFYIFVSGSPSELEAAKSVAQKATSRLP